MAFTSEQIAHARLRILAKKFAAQVIGSGFAMSVPNDIVDQIPPGKEREFLEILPTLRLVRRFDWKWEERL